MQYEINPLFPIEGQIGFMQYLPFWISPIFPLFSKYVRSTMNLPFVLIVYSLNLLLVPTEQNIRYFESANQR